MRSSPRPVRALVAVAALVALAATGCNAAPPPAATVGSSGEVSQADLLDLTAAIAKGNPQVQFEGQGTGTFRSSGTASVLTYLIDREAAQVALEQKGGSITAADRSTAAGQLKNQLTDAVYSKVGAHARAQLVEGEAAALALGRALSGTASEEAQARALFEKTKANYSNVCISTITVPDQKALTSVQQRLQAGEDFAAIAKAVSIDDGAAKGGSIGCVSSSQFDPTVAQQFATASTGDVLGPFGQAGQIIVVRVDGREAATYDSVKDQVAQALSTQRQQAVAAAVAKVQAATKVHVDPRFGRWDRATLSVVPPTAPKAPKARGAARAASTVPAATSSATTAPAP